MAVEHVEGASTQGAMATRIDVKPRSRRQRCCGRSEIFLDSCEDFQLVKRAWDEEGMWMGKSMAG